MYRYSIPLFYTRDPPVLFITAVPLVSCVRFFTSAFFVPSCNILPYTVHHVTTYCFHFNYIHNVSLSSLFKGAKYIVGIVHASKNKDLIYVIYFMMKVKQQQF